MSRRADLSKVADLTQLILDHRLDHLREAASARHRSQMQMDALTAAGAPADLPPVTEGLVGLAYARWADIRRSELNAVLARQTAAWLDARAEAATAFGRVQAIRGVAEKLPRK